MYCIIIVFSVFVEPFFFLLLKICTNGVGKRAYRTLLLVVWRVLCVLLLLCVCIKKIL